MNMSLKKCLRRFRKDENGSAIMIEFVIFVPLIFSLLLMSVEMGVHSMRQMFLDRGLDVTVRYVRLSTDTEMTHPQLKAMICKYSGFLEDCENKLRLEMITLNPREFSAFDQSPDCVDVSEEIKDPRPLDLGREHQMRMLRACVIFKPVFPTTGLGYELVKYNDLSGYVRMVSTAAFVQEPS